MDYKINVEAVASLTPLDEKMAFYVAEITHNSPTNYLISVIVSELMGGWTALGIPPLTSLASAMVLRTDGSTVGTVTFTSRGAYWVSGSFQAVASGTVNTVLALSADGKTYFIGTVPATAIVSGWWYGLTLSLTGNVTGSGLTLSPVGAATLVTAPILTVVFARIVGLLTSGIYITSAVWISNTGTTLLATALTKDQTDLPSYMFGMYHSAIAFSASGTLATINILSGGGYVGNAFVIAVPTVVVGTADRGLLTLTVSVGAF